MTRAQLLDLLGQVTKALDADPQTPATWTEEDREMLREIRAAVVKPAEVSSAASAAAAAPPAARTELPLFTSIPSVAPAAGEPKKSWWKKLGSGLKTTLVAVGAGGGSAALAAAVDAVQHGNVSPTGIATAAIGAAVAGAIGYRAQSPVAKGE